MIDGAKITLGLIDSTIETDSKDVSGNTSEYVNSIDIMETNATDKLASLEKNYFLLDGSFLFPIKDKKYKIGWESEELSDSNGFINAKITIDFDNYHACYGFSIRFLPESIVSDFKINFIKDTVSLYEHKVIDNQEEVTTFVFNSLVENFNKVELMILKVKPLQRSRVSSLILGINQVYTEDELIMVEASNNMSITAEQSNNGELVFEFYNTGGFDIKNISDLPLGMQKNINLECYFKKEGNYERFGKYKSLTTDVKDEGKILTINAQDNLYFISETEYNRGVVELEGQSLYNIAKDIAKDAEIDIFIDDFLSSIITKGYIPSKTSHREALRIVAEAGNCILQTVDGIIGIYKLAEDMSALTELTDDEIIIESFKSDSKNKYDGLIVEGYTYGITKSLVGLAEATDILLTNEPQTIRVDYKSYPAKVESVVYDTTSSIEILSEKRYSDYAEFVVKGDDGDLAWITITGYEYSTAVYIAKRGLIGQSTKEIKNPLIDSKDMAENIADKQWSKLKNSYGFSLDTINSNIQLGDKIKTSQSTFITESKNIKLDSSSLIVSVRGLEV